MNDFHNYVCSVCNYNGSHWQPIKDPQDTIECRECSKVAKYDGQGPIHNPFRGSAVHTPPDGSSGRKSVYDYHGIKNPITGE